MRALTDNGWNTPPKPLSTPVDARYVRITDTGFNALGYGGITGGFDLDAVAIANWERIVE